MGSNACKYQVKREEGDCVCGEQIVSTSWETLTGGKPCDKEPVVTKEKCEGSPCEDLDIPSLARTVWQDTSMAIGRTPTALLVMGVVLLLLVLTALAVVRLCRRRRGRNLSIRASLPFNTPSLRFSLASLPRPPSLFSSTPAPPASLPLPRPASHVPRSPKARASLARRSKSSASDFPTRRSKSPFSQVTQHQTFLLANI
jgi:hypothetical protein